MKNKAASSWQTVDCSATVYNLQSTVYKNRGVE